MCKAKKISLALRRVDGEGYGWVLGGAGRDLDFVLWADTASGVGKKGCQHSPQIQCLPGWTNVVE